MLKKDSIIINAQDRFGRTPLFDAILRGHTDVVKLLLNEEIIDSNREDNEEQIVLLLAAQSGDEEMVRLLLAKNVDINACNKDSRTA